jgi:signal transduction histidine kinase
MLILAATLGTAAAVFAVLFAIQIAQNKRLSRKLKTLNDESRAQLVTMSFPSKSNEELVIEINRLLRAKEAQTQAYRVNEQKLQQAISNISHDMRTPLTAVLGYIRLINRSSISEAERTNYMRIVETRARSLQRLIQDFYDLSRLDAGEYQFDNTWLDVNRICLELLAALYDDFENMGVQADIDLLHEVPKVFADKTAVNRVFENVFGNVKKHGRDKLIVTSKIENGSLVTTVKNGSDVLTASEIERVFERSYTSNSSRADENTGLGLSICKTLLNKMGHEIKAAYHEGYFTISIIWNLESEEINHGKTES